MEPVVEEAGQAVTLLTREEYRRAKKQLTPEQLDYWQRELGMRVEPSPFAPLIILAAWIGLLLVIATLID